MRASLFDVLNGHFSGERALGGVPAAQHQMLSILDNLQRLFNTRQGSVAHLPAYGLPDISEIYHEMPDSVTRLQKAIAEAVRRYEPRLQRVRVEPLEPEPYAMRLEFILVAETADRQRVRFQTTFSTIDPAKVQPYARRD